MGKGGGGTSTQYVKSEQTNLPEYAKPYFLDMMQRAQSLMTQPYTPYGQERIAGFTPQQMAVQQGVAGMQTPGQFGSGSNIARQAGLGALGMQDYRTGQFNVQNVRAPNLQQFQMAAPGQFGAAQAEKYMSPYMQSVIDVSKRNAMEDAQKANLLANLGAARQGTYGGSGSLIASLDRERALERQMGDIQTQGLQSSYENAQQQFERDRAARMQAQRANLEAKLGVQQLGSGQRMQAQLANQQYGLEAQRAREQSRQFGAQQGLQALAQANQSAQTLANLGQMQQQADISRYGLQSSTAAQQQALEQQYLDMAYQDFMRQRDYPQEMLSLYSSLMHGIPVTSNTTQTMSAPNPSLASQLLSTGLGGLSMYNMAQKAGVI